MPFTLYSAGSNAKGQLANGSLDDASEFAPCHFHPTAAVSHKVGAEEQGEPNFKLWADVRQVTSGANHTLLLLQSHQAVINHLYAAGDPSRGQLGPALADSPTPQSSFQRVQLHLERADHHVVRIAAAWETSYFVFRHTDDRKLTSDVLVSVGANDFGDLGNPAPSSRPNPQSKGKGKQPTSLEHITASPRGSIMS
ncbi:hypothetical protein FRB99_003863 [Tulasnella sp. 403]|nr:hypothetical protein FRB99_003863 [Tulasnella sp. 403]